MPAPDAPLPFPQRVRQVFASPRRLFTSFRESAPWLDVLLLSTLVAVLSILAVPDEFFVAQTRDAVTRRGEPVTITSGPEEIARYGRYLGMLGTAVAHPLIAFGVAGVLTLVFSVAGGSGTPFRRHLAVVAHALLIGALGTIAVIALVAMRPGAADWLSPAALLADPAPGGWLHPLLASLDLFTVWMLLVMALGVSTLDARRSWASAASIILGLYLALAAARIALVS